MYSIYAIHDCECYTMFSRGRLAAFLALCVLAVTRAQDGFGDVPLSDFYDILATLRPVDGNSVVETIKKIHTHADRFTDAYAWGYVFIDEDGTCWKTPDDHDRAALFLEIHRAFAHTRGRPKVFFIGLADTGLSKARYADSFAVFSWSKNARRVGDDRQRDILFPVYPGRNTPALIDEACERNIDYSSVRNSARVFGRQTRRCGGSDDNQTMYDGTGPPARCQREYYAALSRDHSDQMDFQLVGDGQPGKIVDFEEFYTNHTFHLSTDGIGADGSTYLLMAHANVVFRTKSQYKMALDDYMTPWKHYVPVMSRSMDDVLAKHRFLLQKPQLVKKIRWHARNLVCRYLTRTAREKFWRTVGSAAEIPRSAAQSLREQRSLYFVPCKHGSGLKYLR